MKIFSGTANPELAREICKDLGIKLGKCKIKKFANDNILVKIEENVREKDVFVIQPSCVPVNEGLVELLIIIDALKHASARRVTAVLPYYPYVRSDKKDQPRISITARLVADLLEAAGTDRLLTMNLHSPQIQGFFRIPTDHLLAAPILIKHFKKKKIGNAVVVSPDAGSAKLAESYARKLRLPLAIMDKRRLGDTDKVTIINIVGDVKGKKAIVFDDEIATGGSLIETAKTLVKHGATEVCACAVHGVLCGNAVKKLSESIIKEVVVTNTVRIGKEKMFPKLSVLSVAKLFASAIERIHGGKSVSDLFSNHLEFAK
ncbi:MAG: ribose-phosphate pyrophosphokinase [Candidatus Tritonobacter lacicola]|nr:ribose-phosphate pyrophosphokinase [Candidatus Tritonobacter lacicola]